MELIELEEKNRSQAVHLFEGWEESLIWSCLQGTMGSLWAEKKENPASARALIADFCFLAGEPNEELLKQKPEERKSDFIIMVAKQDSKEAEWHQLIEKVYGPGAKKIIRYATKKEPGIFNQEDLKKACVIPDKYQLCLIDEAIYNQAEREPWSKDLCSQFKNYDDYKTRGIGAAVLHNGILVSGASSYTVYLGGIEIEIDTRDDYRRKGLAYACGARLILECIIRGLYPSWDAQNKDSLSLAEKLGYHYDKEYVAYEITGFGKK